MRQLNYFERRRIRVLTGRLWKMNIVEMSLTALILSGYFQRMIEGHFVRKGQSQGQSRYRRAEVLKIFGGLDYGKVGLGKPK